jgi:tetratricopeptide (TPR) repeat protein
MEKWVAGLGLDARTALARGQVDSARTRLGWAERIVRQEGRRPELQALLRGYLAEDGEDGLHDAADVLAMYALDDGALGRNLQRVEAAEGDQRNRLLVAEAWARTRGGRAADAGRLVAIGGHPDLRVAQVAVLAAAVRKRDPGLGAQLARLAVDKDGDHAFARRNLGMALVDAGRVEEGVEHLRASYRLDRKPSTANELAWALLLHGDHAEALEIVEEGLQRQNEPELHHLHTLAMAYLLLDRPADAQRMYDKARFTDGPMLAPAWRSVEVGLLHAWGLEEDAAAKAAEVRAHLVDGDGTVALMDRLLAE